MSYDLNGRVIIQRFIVETHKRKDIYTVSQFFKRLNRDEFDKAHHIFAATWIDDAEGHPYLVPVGECILNESEYSISLFPAYDYHKNEEKKENIGETNE